jgi:glucose-6-phosphate 1-dehydrogenase
MPESHADSLVIFGATGDLAYQQIFPALHSMERHGRLDIPVICVARPGLTLERLRERMRQSIADHGDVDDRAFGRLAARVRYVAGEYHDAATFDLLRQALGTGTRPVFYLAIPISLFATVVSGLARGGCAANGRVIVEKPFGRNLDSAKALNATIHEWFPEESVYRIDHFLGKEPVQNLLYFRFANTFLQPVWNSTYVDSVQILLSEAFGVRGRGRFYEEVGAIRDVLQNHLLQILTLLAMEPPAGNDRDAIDTARVGLLNDVRPLRPRDVVLGQYRGYLNERDVAPASRVETYVAARLDIDNPRWAGVPFWIRSGKSLAVTATEVHVRLKRPVGGLFDSGATSSRNMFTFRLSPDVCISLTARTKRPGDAMVGDETRLVEHHRVGDELKAYERLFGDALRGDRTLFASQAGVEAAWRIVDPVLDINQSPYEYEVGSRGPAEAERMTATAGGWIEPGVMCAP